jgi:NADPH-dependent 2,4-dienoyl-CoA reductase/sulfur reductase-like enzyme
MNTTEPTPAATTHYDAIVIGGSYAGLSARCNWRVHGAAFW